MEEGAFRHWLEKEASHICKEALAMKPAFLAETVHRLRTHTKKLRAVLRLTDINTGHKTKLPGSFRKLYRLAGDLRDKQVALQAVVQDKQNSLPLFAVWLSIEISSAVQALNAKKIEKTVERLTEKVSDLRAEPDTKALQQYVSNHLENIKQLSRPHADDGMLHEIRKLVKDMHHVVDCCRKIWPEGYQVLQPMEKILEQLSDRAGEYNDLRNRLDMLDQFRQGYSEELIARDIAIVAAANQDWRKQKTAARRRLIAAVRRFVLVNRES